MYCGTIVELSLMYITGPAPALLAVVRE